MKTAAVFVHGLWLTGAESALMRRRLSAQYGFECHSFTYRSAGRPLPDVLERLAQFVARIEADRVHFVGHSLGGVILYRYFETRCGAPPGRVVFLASPTVKCRAAEQVGRLPVFSSLIGPIVTHELAKPCERHWRCERELGLIAGTRPMGLGRFFARFQEECDGTVAVSETKLPGHTAHMTLPVSHMGMLASSDVARQVGTFLEFGRFAT
jgi:alpha/beta hydrolase family protein